MKRALAIAAVVFATVAVATLAYRIGAQHGATAAHDHPPPAAAAPAERRVLYWYDPMAPQQHFDRPGKSPFMDMDLVPRYADEVTGGIDIDPGLAQSLGVRTARAGLGTLVLTRRYAATFALDARASVVVQARVAGIVEQLLVFAPLDPVRRGQVLMRLNAPEWSQAQSEYLALLTSASPGLEPLRAAARERLHRLGLEPAQVAALERTRRLDPTIAVFAPRDGVLGELAVREGAGVMAGSPLARIDALDPIWLEAAVPEADADLLPAGTIAGIDVPAYPGLALEGRVERLLPDTDAGTRTRVARIVLPNPQARFAPGMTAQVRIRSESGEPRVLVPREAVIATGTRRVVIVADGGGRFGAREVSIGREGDAQSEVLEGVADGELVVSSGQFLIDSEASLTGALRRLGGSGEKAPDAPPPGEAPR